MTKFQRLSKEDRERQIQKAAQEVFLRKGFQRTTMEDIIEASGMSKGGVYNYYKNTAEILYGIMMGGMRYRIAKMEKEMMSSGMPTEMIFLEGLIDKMIEQNEFKSIYVIFLLESAKDEQLQELYRKLESDSIQMIHAYWRTKVLDEERPAEFFFEKSMMAFINSIMIGSELPGFREAFQENREMFRIMLKAYWKEKHHFEVT